MLDPLPFTWTSERAIAMVATNDRAFAETISTGGIGDVAAAIDAASRPGWKSAHEAMRIIADHVSAGQLRTLARACSTAVDTVVGDQRTFPRLSHVVVDGDFALVRWGENDLAFTGLRFRPEDLQRLAYEHSFEKVLADRRAKWLEQCAAVWPPLSSAIRLMMQETNEDGERFAVMAYGEGWNRDDKSKLSTLVAMFGETDAPLFAAALAAWAQAREDILRRLQEGKVTAWSNGVAIAASEWATGRPDWWASSLGRQTGIRVRKADIETFVAGAAVAKLAPGKRGPKVKYDWSGFDEEVRRILELEGGIAPKVDPGPYGFTQAKLVEHMAKWCQHNWGVEPALSMLKDRVSKVLREADNSTRQLSA